MKTRENQVHMGTSAQEPTETTIGEVMEEAIQELIRWGCKERVEAGTLIMPVIKRKKPDAE